MSRTQPDPHDAIARTLLARVETLLEIRPDITRAVLGEALHRGPSWVSEFLSGSRTTNSLRLVLRLADLFDVSVNYLLGVGVEGLDAQTAVLMKVWCDLDAGRREALLEVARTIKRFTSAEVEDLT